MNSEKCQRSDLVQERSLNQQWGVLDNGDVDLADFRGDGATDEFENYLCSNCDTAFHNWKSALRHVGVSHEVQEQ